MTEKECEKKIIRLLSMINKVYSKYNPNGKYLMMYILNEGDIMSLNNRYWDEDAETPLNIWVNKNGEVTQLHE